MSSCVNPRRRTPVTRLGAESSEAALKASMALRKGATFHSPTSPTSPSLDFTPPGLPRSQTLMEDVVDANRRRIALTLNDIDEALSLTAEGSSTLPKSPRPTSLRDTSLPIPRGFLDAPVVDPAMAKEAERRVLRPRSVRRSRHHASDSGLGTSIASASDKDAEVAKVAKSVSAITRSAASSAAALPSLSSKAVSRIQGHVLRPLLEKPSLKDFEPIVLDVPRRIRDKEIICLRDLEKTLIFMAPDKAKTSALYLDFCLTSILCIQATVEYISDREQVRPGDRPYTNGYFIDLKEQIYQYGRLLADVKKGDVTNEMDVDQDDEIKLYGGIAETGRPAELIRVKKDGTAISMATGLPVDLEESPYKLKRSLSEQREDEEEIMRSMARRKKNASPEELAPKKCREPGCNKEFKRPCDLTKHEKTHSRPWKCPIPTCKYHEFGWPTEKEMDRHINDKHSDAPAMYECLYKPCPYKSKRESNCKQHMEKAHGWTYVRTKTNKKGLAKASISEQQTPPLGNVSTPDTTPAYSVPTPPEETGLAPMASDFPLYQPDSDWLAANGLQPNNIDTLIDMDMDVDLDLSADNTSPSSAATYDNYPPYQNGSTFILNDEDIYAATATVHIPAQLSTPEQLYNKQMPQQLAPYPSHTIPSAPYQVSAPPHFSPTGQQNAMLFTPNSMRDVDEGFDETFAGDDADFQLFPSHVNKEQEFQSLFVEMPSANLGFSQASQQDLFSSLDWANMDFQNLQE
ncbi:hypothetical protein B0I35DRAFT_473390 [Stachybotrys elegans]|uniref:C2H2-type domain-containing protein n=1 Tax=Stachybotrys elegans TaxID=80388 RepID=A0A8K0T2J9_9HYPO|nr:hypothetical protein B0I35DRAFT_473390 [Stachybotrys elegans]